VVEIPEDIWFSALVALGVLEVVPERIRMGEGLPAVADKQKNQLSFMPTLS
jgi:hypothetical protein